MSTEHEAPKSILEVEDISLDESLYVAARSPRRLARCERLLASLRELGQQVPITAVRVDAGRNRVVDGARRVAALRELGMATVSATILDRNTEVEVWAATANSHRATLSTEDQLLFAERLLTAKVSQAKVALALGKDAAEISKINKVVERMRGTPAWEAFLRGEIALATLKALARIDDEAARTQWAEQAIAGEVDGRTLEGIAAAPRDRGAEAYALAEQLRAMLGLVVEPERVPSVDVRPERRGAGVSVRIQLRRLDPDEVEALTEMARYVLARFAELERHTDN